MKKGLLKLLLLILLTGLSGCKLPPHISKDNNIKEQESLNLNKHQPLIFLHGSGGSNQDLTQMAEAIFSEQKIQTSHLFVSINKMNDINYENQLTNENELPLIFIGFDDRNAPIEEWSNSLGLFLEDLYRLYQFEKVTLVGFSNGGLASGYFTEIQQDYPNSPLVDKLIMIGAPFNDLEPLNHSVDLDFTDLSNQDPYLDPFIEKKEEIASDLAVLSIAGDLDDNSQSDGIVPVTSALASRLIFLDQVKLYQERLSLGSNSSHIGLISGNQDVISWVKAFIQLPETVTKENPLLISSQ